MSGLVRVEAFLHRLLFLAPLSPDVLEDFDRKLDDADDRKMTSLKMRCSRDLWNSFISGWIAQTVVCPAGVRSPMWLVVVGFSETV
jgi:hypothetical protein